MSVKEQIDLYISGQPGSKQADVRELHQFIIKLLPKAKLWFLDGKNEQGKVVSNPNIGYGGYTMKYADGSTREFYQVGLSANTSGISVYVLGIDDKTYLKQTYAERLGKATVTGYCIKFRNLKDIKIDVLGEAIKDGVKQSAN